MSEFKLIGPEDNTWSGSLMGFNPMVANSFYSYGAPNTLSYIQGFGHQQATVVFQSEDFFNNIVDADKKLDMNNLAPGDFEFVDSFFNGTSGLSYGSYTAASLKAMNVKGLSISGNLYDIGSNIGNSKTSTSGLFSFRSERLTHLAIGSYTVEIAKTTTFHIGPTRAAISGFGYKVADDNYDFISSNVPGWLNGTLSVINTLHNPFGDAYEKVNMRYQGYRWHGLVNYGNYKLGYRDISGSTSSTANGTSFGNNHGNTLGIGQAGYGAAISARLDRNGDGTPDANSNRTSFGNGFGNTLGIGPAGYGAEISGRLDKDADGVPDVNSGRSPDYTPSSMADRRGLTSRDGVSSGSGGGSSHDSGGGFGKPIVVDMNGDGIELSKLAVSTTDFDFDDDGYLEPSKIGQGLWVKLTNWQTDKSGVVDRDSLRRGRITADFRVAHFLSMLREINWFYT